MIIKNLDLKNFRNYEELHIKFDKNTNLFYGDNAQGKTNILEAIYVCATTKSHRGSKDREIIRFREDESHIRIAAEKNNIPYTIDMHLKKNRPKGIAINGVPIHKASELFGTINVVCFSPEDLNIIKDGPAVRRRFIDLEMCQLSPVYVHSLISYNKILNQKNKLLREIAFHRESEETLDVWDEQLEKYGKEVNDQREEFISELNSITEVIHYKISGQKEKIKIEYEKNEYRDMRQEELKQKTTLSGPHRDDIGFYINGIDIRKYGSQGQQRTAALSLKLAEIELVKRKTGDFPILLLDDVLSELDAKRQTHLLDEVSDIQTVITCTGVEDYLNNSFKIGKLMHVIEGSVTEEMHGGRY